MSLQILINLFKKIRKEVLKCHSIKVEQFDSNTLAAISSVLRISLINEIDFYKELLEKLHDSDELLQTEKNTAEKTISIEVGPVIQIYMGSTAFVKCQSLHEALWRVLMYHIIFLVPTPEWLRNTAGFFAVIMGWPFFDRTARAKKFGGDVLAAKN